MEIWDEEVGTTTLESETGSETGTLSIEALNGFNSADFSFDGLDFDEA